MARLIDADLLLEEIERIYSDHYAKSAYQFIHDFVNAIRKRIRGARTVDAVEVVHGRWIESTNTVYMMSQYTCSECGGKHIAKTWNYCPNCGAKMDGDV